MPAVHSLATKIHSRAVEISARYKHAEAELIEILQQVEKHGVFIRRGHSSLFNYATRELGLGESVAATLITVARKSSEVPAMLDRIREGSMTLSNARRIAPVVTPETQGEWIEKACTLSNRQLEKEVVRVRPREATRERAFYVTPERVKLELGLSEREMLKLRRVQDLLSQSKRRAVSLEETLIAMTSEFLHRYDPVEKAKRHEVRKGPAPVNPTVPVGKHVTLHVENEREPIPAALEHQVNLRDQRRCVQILPDGSRCNQGRWIEIHHQIPVSHGGKNTIENLVTLCGAHHKLRHLDST